jgi:hypothetical protein
VQRSDGRNVAAAQARFAERKGKKLADELVDATVRREWAFSQDSICL